MDFRTPSEAIGAWMSKLAGHTLRISMALHAIECYNNRRKDSTRLTLDTLQRAEYLAYYYRSCTYTLHGKMIGSELPSLLAKIQAKAEREGKLAMADIYRNISAIRSKSKNEGMKISEYTLSLCRDLHGLGKGEVSEENGVHYYTPKIQHSDTPNSETLEVNRFERVTLPTHDNTQEENQHTDPGSGLLGAEF